MVQISDDCYTGRAIMNSMGETADVIVSIDPLPGWGSADRYELFSLFSSRARRNHRLPALRYCAL